MAEREEKERRQRRSEKAVTAPRKWKTAMDEWVSAESSGEFF